MCHGLIQLMAASTSRKVGLLLMGFKISSHQVHVCSPKRNSPKGLSPHNIPGGQDPKPQWGPGPKVQWH